MKEISCSSSSSSRGGSVLVSLIISVCVCISICIIIKGLITKLLMNYNNHKKRNQLPLPPGPFPLPILGNILNVLGNKPHKSFSEIAKKYGPLISLQMGNLTTVVISSPSIAQELFQKYDGASGNRTVRDSVTVLDHHQASVAFLPLGPKWRQLRRITTSQIFASVRLDASQELRMKKVEQLLCHVKQCSEDKIPVNIGEAAFTVMFNILSNTMFSTDVATFSSTTTDHTDDGCSKGHNLKDLVSTLLVEGGKPNLSDFFPMLKPFDLQGIHRRVSSLLFEIIKILDEIVEKRKLIKKQTATDQYLDHEDVLDTLLRINNTNNNNQNGQQVNAVDIPHLCSDLFIAGTDTTSTSIEWAMTELVRNPEIMKKAQAELDRVVGKGNLVRETDVARLPYLQAIIKETLRLHPSVALILRKVSADVELRGYRIPKGAQVLINAWAIGRDETLWESSSLYPAGCFKPERFLSSSSLSLMKGKDNKYSNDDDDDHHHINYMGNHFNFIPFGFGSRICLGLQLAHRVMPIMLGSLISCFDWKLQRQPHDQTDIDIDDKFGLTLQKAHPLCVVPVQRS